MASIISLYAPAHPVQAKIALPASKSESNRALIIQALSPESITLHNLSSARDTQTMIRLLQSEGHVLDVIDAGTTMRFLTAFFAAVGRDQILTGTPRMCQRPIGILVEALRSLGADIEYWKQEGYPPLHIISKGQRLAGGELAIQGNVSSQFISAVLMIAPTLAGGLKLELTGDITSRPYLEMTRSLMAHFGVKSKWEEQTLLVPERPYQPGSYTIESDWSAASYWYAVVALAEQAEVTLLGLRKKSWQGDQAIAKYMQYFGVETSYEEAGVRLRKTEPKKSRGIVKIDFTETPDLAQTIAVVSAAKGIPVHMSGLHTLRIKETDRIAALKTELGKFGVDLEVDGNVCELKGQIQQSDAWINTYDDHRMAMAFAPLVFALNRLTIKEPEVVQKSYPEFWQHLEQAGLRLQEG